MKILIRTILCLAVIALPFAGVRAAREQASGQGTQNPPKAPPPSQQSPAAPSLTLDAANPPVNAEEEAAYKAFREIKDSDVQHKIEVGEEFLRKYPQSRYLQDVYTRLTNMYWMVGQPDKMFAAGEKALELNPDNVDVLAPLAVVLPRSVNAGSLDAGQKLAKAESYSKRAITVLETMQKPAGLSEEDFTKAKNEKLAMSHSGLGLVDYHRQKYTDAVAELEQAVKLSSLPDPVDFYVLGLAYQQSKRHGDAATAFGHCAEISGTMQERCKQSAEAAKKMAATQPAPPKP